jgi:ParB-like nuclease domain
MAKRRVVDVSADLETVPSVYRRSIPLLPRQNIALAELRMNPRNAEIFRQESEEYFARLREDIRTRGIVVPLIAKKDGTLLAGHNRYTIAKELNLQYVPVEYVKEELSEEREQEFLIKDNLLRRQFTTQEWISIYTKLYPDFEQTYLGDDDARRTNGKNVQKSLTIGQIANETGQSEGKIKMQIKRERERRTSTQRASTSSRDKRSSSALLDSNSVTIKKESVPQEQELLQAAQILVLHFQSAHTATQKKIRKMLKDIVTAV